MKKDINLKNSIKWFVGYVLFVIIVFLLYFCFLDDYIPNYATVVSRNDEEQVIHDINNDMVIEQIFESPRDFDFVSITLSNHDIVIEGNMYFAIFDSNDNLITKKSEKCTSIHYGSKHPGTEYIEFDGKKNTEYTLVISTDNECDDGMGIFAFYPKEINSNYAIVNDEVQNYVISLELDSYTKVFQGIVLTIICICILWVLFLIIFFAVIREGARPESLFLAIVIPFSLCMFLMINNYAYDYPYHMISTYRLANIILGCGNNDTADVTSFREGDYSIVNCYDDAYALSNNSQACKIYEMYEDWQWFSKSKKMVEEPVSVWGLPLSFIPYIPYAIGNVLGRILCLGTYPMWFLTRLFGTLVYIFFCYYAIKITPLLKNLFAFTAASPMAIYSVTSVSYDGMTIAFALLVIAFIYKWWIDKLTRKEWFIVGVLLFGLLGCKGAVYCPLILMFLIVPLSRFKFSKKQVIVAGVIVLSVMGTFILVEGRFLLNSILQTQKIVDGGTKYGLGFIISSPMSFVKMLVLTFVKQQEWYIEQFFGYTTQWAHGKIPLFVIIIYLLIFFSVSMCDVNKDYLDKNALLMKKKKYIVAFLLLEYVLIHLALLTDTYISYNYINGVQGRYFLPLAPFIFFLFIDTNLFRSKDNRIKEYILYAMNTTFYLMFIILLFMSPYVIS